MGRPTKEDAVGDVVRLMKAYGIEPEKLRPATVVPRKDGNGWDITMEVVVVEEWYEAEIEFDLNELESDDG